MLQSKRVKHKDQYDGDVIAVWDNERMEQEAYLAFQFIERWGMVAAMPDGEDGAQRQKMRLATPEEVVQRALEVSRLFMLRIRASGLIHKTPDLPGCISIDVENGDDQTSTRTV